MKQRGATEVDPRLQPLLDRAALAALVAQGAGGSWQLANRADTMIDNHFDHGFAVNWMRNNGVKVISMSAGWLSWGPGLASGWYWTESTGRSRWRKPSTVPSLRLTWVTSMWSGSESGSVAKPWFWEVISPFPVI